MATIKKRKLPTQEHSQLQQNPIQNDDVPVTSDDENDLYFLTKGGLLLDATQSDDETDEEEEAKIDSDDESDGEGHSDFGSDSYSEEDHQPKEEYLGSDEIPSDLTDEETEDDFITSAKHESQGQRVDIAETVAHYSDLGDELPPGTRVVMDSAGNPRYLYPEIIPKYDSDDTDAGENENTIGNIPLSTYDLFPHIGYDINGKKISRPAAGKALDQLLDSIELPKGWTGLINKNTGKELQLTDEELKIVSQIQRGRVADKLDDEDLEYAPTVEWFTSKTEIMPLSAAPEPKRRFVPSKHEAKRASSNKHGSLSELLISCYR